MVILVAKPRRSLRPICKVRLCKAVRKSSTNILLFVRTSFGALNDSKHRTLTSTLMKSWFLLTLIPVIFISCGQDDLPPPNILWITSEDNGPFLGCYGDTFATTPNLDRFASQGFLYTHAYANAPVCAPSRNTIITGVYAVSSGQEHMRSKNPMSEGVRLYPQLLREAGYYCTNNQKEDFNIDPKQTKDVWDELGRTAHYRNRPAGKPFFAIFNSTISHESSIHSPVPVEELRHKPEGVKLPPYHPDTEEFRRDWALYYDRIEDMDTWVGSILQELEESGEAENTIVFYYSDHGGVLGRSKRFVYETGTRVPFIVRIPEKYKHLYPASAPGQTVDRLISLVDLPPTLMSLLGQAIPDYMQGHAFLGKHKTSDPEYAFMFRGRMDERYDMSRAIRDAKFRYIRNYMPHREYGQYIQYLWQAPSMRSWEAAFRDESCNEIQSRFWLPKPVEELYHTESDPWEVNNLAADPKYKEVLERMRAASVDWMKDIRDAGFIPEAQRVEVSKGSSTYDYMRTDRVDLPKLIETADRCTRATGRDVPELVALLSSENETIRYWAATGLLILKDAATPALESLKKAASDPSPDVAIVAGESLYYLGEEAIGRESILQALKSDNSFARVHALNTLDCVGDDSPAVRSAVLAFVKSQANPNSQSYDWRSAIGLLRQWKIDVTKYERNAP